MTFANRWGTAASLLNLLIFIVAPLTYWHVHGWVAFREIERLLWLPTLIGLVVLVVFSSPSKKADGPTLAQPSN